VPLHLGAWDRARTARDSQVEEIRVLGKDWPQEIAGCAGRVEGGSPCRKGGHGRLEVQALEAASDMRRFQPIACLERWPLLRALMSGIDPGSSEDGGCRFHKSIEVMREGLPDYELVAEIDYVMRQMGSTDNFQMLAVGKQNTGMLLP